MNPAGPKKRKPNGLLKQQVGTEPRAGQCHSTQGFLHGWEKPRQLQQCVSPGGSAAVTPSIGDVPLWQAVCICRSLPPSPRWEGGRSEVTRLQKGEAERGSSEGHCPSLVPSLRRDNSLEQTLNTAPSSAVWGCHIPKHSALCILFHPSLCSLSLFGHTPCQPHPPDPHSATEVWTAPTCPRPAHRHIPKAEPPLHGAPDSSWQGCCAPATEGEEELQKKNGDYAKINQQEHSLRLRPRHSSRDITIRAVTPGTPWKQQGSQPCVLQAQQPLSPAWAGRSCVPQAGPSMHPQHLSLVMGLSVDDTCFSFGPKYTIWLEPRRLDPTEIKLRSARRGGSGFLLSFHPELPLAPSEKESCSQPRHTENCSSQRGQSLAP